MTAVLHNIRLESNADFELAVQWSDSDGTVHAVSDAEMEIRTADGELIVAASVADGRITIDGENWVHILIPRAVVGGLTPFAQASYDLLLTRTSDGRVKRALEGKAVYSAGVTS